MLARECSHIHVRTGTAGDSSSRGVGALSSAYRLEVAEATGPEPIALSWAAVIVPTTADLQTVLGQNCT